ncbi:MAG: tetratricopeptide repeat protein [Candidatus Odinarchaeota archaeon]
MNDAQWRLNYPLKPVASELQRIERLLHEEGKIVEALHIIEKLESNTALDDSERLQFRILKSEALFSNRALISDERLDEALKLANEAFEESQQQADPGFFVDALVPKIMWNLADAEQHQEFLLYIEKAERILQADAQLPPTDRERRQFNLQHWKAIIYGQLGELDEALQGFQEALTGFEESGNKYEAARVLISIGYTYQSSHGDHTSAIQYYQRSLTVSEELDNPDKVLISYGYFHIGNCYASLGDLDQAMGYHQKSLDTMEELGNKLGMAKLLLEIGDSFQFNLRDYDRAVDWYRKSLAISRELDYKHGIAWCYLRIGNYHYIYQGDLDQGMDYFQKSLELLQETGEASIWIPLACIGNIYSSKGHLEQALKYRLKALQSTREAKIKNRFTIMQALRGVGAVHHAMGRFNNALNHYQQSLSILEEHYPENRSQLSWSLYFLFSLHFEHELVEQAAFYLQKLDECAEKAGCKTPGEQKLVNLFYRLAKARVLKSSDRFIEKAEAQAILRDIVSEDIIYHKYTIEAMFFLCEVLLEELKLSGTQTIIEEVKELANRIHGTGQEYHAYPVMLNALILQSKLAMLEEDIEGATGLLTQAALLADGKGLTLFQKRVKQEQADLDAQLEKWKSLYERNAPVFERIERARLDEYLRKAHEAVKLLK